MLFSLYNELITQEKMDSLRVDVEAAKKLAELEKFASDAQAAENRAANAEKELSSLKISQQGLMKQVEQLRSEAEAAEDRAVKVEKELSSFRTAHQSLVKEMQKLRVDAKAAGELAAQAEQKLLSFASRTGSISTTPPSTCEVSPARRVRDEESDDGSNDRTDYGSVHVYSDYGSDYGNDGGLCGAGILGLQISTSMWNGEGAVALLICRTTMSWDSWCIGYGVQDHMGGHRDSTSHYEGNWMNLMMVTGYSGHWRLGGVQLYLELSWDDLALHGQHSMGNGQTYGSQIRLRTALP